MVTEMPTWNPDKTEKDPEPGELESFLNPEPVDTIDLADVPPPIPEPDTSDAAELNRIRGEIARTRVALLECAKKLQYPISRRDGQIRIHGRGFSFNWEE